MIKTRIIFFLLLIFLAFKCDSVIKSPNKLMYLPPETPENILKNLETSYNNYDLDGYLSNLSDDYIFIYKSFILKKEDERKIHERMFSGDYKINLELTKIQAITEESEANTQKIIVGYNLGIEGSKLDEVISGRMELTLVKENDEWLIERWEDIFLLGKESNPKYYDNYFPLQIGNWWEYWIGMVPIGTMRTEIIDTVRINRDLFYEFKWVLNIPGTGTYTTINYYMNTAKTFYKERSNDILELNDLSY
ncbi:MAG: hypothetical protein ACE5KE_08130 [Methanosarcinales archaeon]